jgi:hypothetical protein
MKRKAVPEQQTIRKATRTNTRAIDGLAEKEVEVRDPVPRPKVETPKERGVLKSRGGNERKYF